MSASEFAAKLPLRGGAALKSIRKIINYIRGVTVAVLKFARWLIDYVHAVGWIVAAMAVLYLADMIGMATVLPFGFAHHQPAWVDLLLSVNIYNLGRIQNNLAWEVFFSLAIFRMMVSDPLHYWFGARTERFITARRNPDEPKKPGRIRRSVQHLLSRLPSWLKFSGKPAVLAGVFFLTLIQIPRPISYFFAPANPFVIAGATGIKLRYVMVVDLVATISFLVLFYYYGAGLLSMLASAV